MKKNNILMLIASAILVAGVIITGCTQNSGNEARQSSDSSGSTAVQTPTPSVSGQVNNNDRPAFNQSGAHNGTSLSGCTMNRTHPSGTPPSGMMNGTRPAGPPPAGLMNGTPPAKTTP